MKKKFRIGRILLAFILIVVFLSSNIQPVLAAKKAPVMNLSSVTLCTGKESLWEQTYVKLQVANATKKIIWSSSDKSIATVEKGTVKAVSKGKCVITATIGKTKLTCDVTVINKPSNATIQKKMKVSTKRIGDYVKITVKNNNKYPVKVSLTVGAYNYNDRLITEYYGKGYVNAGEKTYFYSSYHANLQDKYGDDYYFELIDRSYDFLVAAPGDISLYDKTQYTFKYNGFVTESEGVFKGYKPEITCTNNSEFDAVVCYNLLMYKDDELYMVEEREVSVPAGETSTAPYGLSTLSYNSGYNEEDDEFIYNAKTHAEVCEYLEQKYKIKVVPSYAYTE